MASFTETYHDSSKPCLSSRLDLFSKPPIDYSIEQVIQEEFCPSVPITPDSKSFTINVEGSGQYIDLRELSLQFSLKILQSDNSVLPPVSRDEEALFLGCGFDQSIGLFLSSFLDGVKYHYMRVRMSVRSSVCLKVGDAFSASGLLVAVSSLV